MRWGIFFSVTFIIACLLLLLWPSLKQLPIKDKTIFFLLLFLGWGLSIFDLQNIAGPMSWMRFIFKPFVSLLG